MAAMPTKSSSLFKTMHFMRSPLFYTRINARYAVVFRTVPPLDASPSIG
jgi:hypothetical protein